MGMGCYSHPNVIWVCSCLECEPQATGILTQFHDCFPVDLTWRFQLEHFPFRWGKTLSWLVVLPSGNLLHSYWKWWFIVDLPIENMVIFHSFLYVYPRVPPFMIWDDPFKWRWPLSRLDTTSRLQFQGDCYIELDVTHGILKLRSRRCKGAAKFCSN